MGRYRRHLSIVKRAAKRFIRLRRRLKVILVAAVLVNASLLLQLYINTHVYPNTYLGSQNVSGKNPAQLQQLAKQYLSLPYTVRIQNRDYTYSYADIGISIDENQLHALVFAPNLRWYPVDILLFFKSLLIPRTVPVPLVFTQDFSRFIDESVFDFSDIPDAVVFDGNDKNLTYIENDEKYRIDESYFISLVKSRVGVNTAPLYPKLTKQINYKELAVTDTSERMKSMYLEPLTVMLEMGGGTKSFILSEKELSDMTVIRLSQDQTSVDIELNPTVVNRLVDKHIQLSGILSQGVVATPKVIAEIRDILIARYNGHEVNALSIEYDKGPNTNGSYASRYIEVDISQQKMYLFDKNKLVMDYRVSTGKDYPTPTGEFKILNKVGLGYSSIYNVWMPWWMGFSYSNELHAYFGIHELPYAVVGGDKIQRPREFIGAPNTGGCIALDVGAAQKVYQFADVGTPVLIYE